jgi:murein DD-endopeptidase MepM/ murein hydrolase activator NlpD
MSRFVIIITLALTLVACDNNRPLLPVSEAPLRQEVRDVPPTGVIEVLPGDTIYVLANRYRVTPRRLILANDLVPPDYNISGRRVLNVPKPRAHIIAAGDTLEVISERYKVSVTEIIRLNALSPPIQLHPGQAIAIPRRLDYSLLDLPEDRTGRPLATSSGKVGRATVPKTGLTSRTVSYSSVAPDFTWPVNGQIILPFGTSARGVHNDGVNIAAGAGDSVRASQNGEVAFVGSGLKAFGNLVLVKHRGGWITAYAHLGDVTVKEGDVLARGQVLGVVGQTGRVDSPQLHFEVRRAREPVNPEDFLS